MADNAYLGRLEKDLIDKGLLVEAGWISFRIAVMPPNAPAVQIEEMRKAFFAGAQHLFSSIMTVLEPGEEPTESDFRRLSNIDAELKRFGEAWLKNLKTEGQG